MKGPLAGIKVIELAQIMAGPTCGMLLADMGADVIKVEKLPGGDDTRAYAEPSIKGESAPFMILNRNKRGIAVNLKKPGGLEVVKRLLAGADVVTENYRKGTLEKLGLGYDVLKELNPRLVYCAVSGYGRTGPYADKGGFDLIAQGFAGIMSITGEPGGPPAKSGTSIADINAGILAALGIVSALVARSTTGEGQMVETSLMEAAIQQTYWHASIFFATGMNPGPTGSAHLLTAPYQAFPTNDGWINVGGANQANWERIVKVIGAPELAHDSRFKTNVDRLRNIDALSPLIAAADAHALFGRLARRIRCGRSPRGPRQQDRRHAARSPGACARHGRGSRSREGRARESARHAREILRHTGRNDARRAAPGPAHSRGAGGLGYSHAEIDKLHEDGAVLVAR